MLAGPGWTAPAGKQTYSFTGNSRFSSSKTLKMSTTLSNALVEFRYFRAAAFAGIGTVGTMMCAYLVPFHITQGPPLCGSVGKAAN